eukprot:Nitzschia sp. Nitz4//scaffold109_size72162//19781//21066//NITZ4_005839-RA/size72162-snap-gene-0.95-mRNA-1//1//CDS//3329532742//6759//frame0
MASFLPFQATTKYLRKSVAWRPKLAISSSLSPRSLQGASPLSTRFFTSDEKTPSGAEYHAFFQEQLAELNRERVSLFGTADDQDEDDPFSSTMNQTHQMNNQTAVQPPPQTQVPPPPVVPTMEEPVDNTYEQDMEDLHAEREALFKFSAEEKHAWGTMASKPDATLSPQLMQEIARARQAHFEVENQPPIPEAPSSVPPSSPPPPPSSSTQFMQPEPKVITPDSSHHPSFSHVSHDGASVHMVDVGSKQVSTRTATAQTKVLLPSSVLEAFADGEPVSNVTELVGPKGPIFATAKVAGIMAAKKTSDLIPLCHPLPLDQVKVDISMNPMGEVLIECTCRVTHKTGVEMEALTGATVTALTIYDMVKAVSHHVQITDTKLITKTGGKRTVKNAEYV